MNNEMYFIFAPSNDGGLDTISLTTDGTFKPNAQVEDLMIFDTIKSATRYIQTNGLDSADFDIITNF